jgi:hypothetical protein
MISSGKIVDVEYYNVNYFVTDTLFHRWSPDTNGRNLVTKQYKKGAILFLEQPSALFPELVNYTYEFTG